jgi:ribosomal protein S12 methylthiotransferase accessory factor
MSINVEFLENKKLKASFDGFEVFADQPESGGGNNSAPSPFDYLPAATALCAAHYARVFCEKRGLDFHEIKVSQKMEKVEQDSSQRKILIIIELPKEFPEKYHKALTATVNSCAVKKVIESAPIFETILKP